VAQRLGKLIAVALNDSMTINDALGRVTLALRMPTDSLAILDLVYRSTRVTRGVLDSMSVSDTVARNQILARALVDAITISDSVTRGAQIIHVSFADFMLMYDTFSNAGLAASHALVNMIVGVQDEMPSQVRTRELIISADDLQKPGPNVKPSTYGQ